MLNSWVWVKEVLKWSHFPCLSKRNSSHRTIGGCVSVAYTLLKFSVQTPFVYCGSVQVSLRSWSRLTGAEEGLRSLLSIPLDSLLSWGQTLHRDALPAAPPPGPQSRESAAAVLHGSSGPGPPGHSVMVSSHTQTQTCRVLYMRLRLFSDITYSRCCFVSCLHVWPTFSKPCSTTVIFGLSWLWTRGSVTAFFRS